MTYEILTYDAIDRTEWGRLVRESETGTWFQSPEAYMLFASMPDLFMPFAIAVERVNELTNERKLRGVCVGYVTRERNAIKQYFTRRAIILGGPVLSDDCSDAEVITLLEAVKTKTRHLQSLDSDLPETTPQSAYMHASRQSEDLSRVADEQPDASQKHSLSVGSVSPTTFPVRSQKSIGFSMLTKNTKNRLRNLCPIYIETRNFNDYSKWRGAFEKARFEYKKHLNFHIDCTDKEAMWERLSEVRRRQVKKAISNGVEIKSEGISEAEIREWYQILKDLYAKKVKTPLFPLEFFLSFYRKDIGKYLLVKYRGKVIGGMICPIMDGRTIYEWYICGLDNEYREQYPSVMATWAAMEYANEHGLARFDVMGAGVPGVPYGVRDFKAEFGGELVEQGRFLCVCKPWLYRLGTFVVKLMKRRKQIKPF